MTELIELRLANAMFSTVMDGEIAHGNFLSIRNKETDNMYVVVAESIIYHFDIFESFRDKKGLRTAEFYRNFFVGGGKIKFDHSKKLIVVSGSSKRYGTFMEHTVIDVFKKSPKYSGYTLVVFLPGENHNIDTAKRKIQL